MHDRLQTTRLTSADDMADLLKTVDSTGPNPSQDGGRSHAGNDRPSGPVGLQTRRSQGPNHRDVTTVATGIRQDEQWHRR